MQNGPEGDPVRSLRLNQGEPIKVGCGATEGDPYMRPYVKVFTKSAYLSNSCRR